MRMQCSCSNIKLNEWHWLSKIVFCANNCIELLLSRALLFWLLDESETYGVRTSSMIASRFGEIRVSFSINMSLLRTHILKEKIISTT